MFVWLSLALLALGAPSSASLRGSVRVCTWNIQDLGMTKLAKAEVVERINEILSRCDITAIQEISDSQLRAHGAVLESLNAYVAERPDAAAALYEGAVSERVGRSSAKEQYFIVYNPELFTLEANVVYDDTTDVFARPPQVAVFSTADVAGMKKFAMINIHTKPDATSTDYTVKEISFLATVSDWAKSHYDIENTITLGDFNGACSYVTGKDWEHIELFTREEFKWLVPDWWDTTVSYANCAYDRVILSGSELQRAYVPSSAHVVRLDETLGVSLEEADLVSDHHAVMFELRRTDKTKSTLWATRTLSVTDKTVTSSAMRWVESRLDLGTDTLPDSLEFYKDGSQYVIEQTKYPTATEGTLPDVVAEMAEAVPSLMTPAMLEAINYKVSLDALMDPSVPGMTGYSRTLVHTAELRCTSGSGCTLSVTRPTSIV